MAEKRDRERRITAVLGPTNTGKTHMAVDRMLAHRSGLIGFPLRLLAREIYDKVVALKGPRAVALITGEEKILPPKPRYILATVESMPLDHAVDFLAVDEIQLASDPERGHVFTDRLLHARGTVETMFLGADTIRPLIRRLVPEAVFTGRPRFSELRYSGHKKLGRLAPRTAVVAFSAQDVYALAEVMRAQRGGCAVVLGALSPRTRNAQVAMYQAGEIDYLVATDAIGMGLNMDLDHVAFSAQRKFDGRNMRQLNAAELAQIAGRAGRHLRDGTFGTTADLQEIDSESVEAVEQHRFAKIKEIFWRNSDLSFYSLERLAQSLDKSPTLPGLRRLRDGADHLTLLALSRDEEVLELAKVPDLVRLLWETCQIPDFRKTLADSHISLVRQIFLNLARSGALPEPWIAERIAGLDRSDGDIDTLTTRISHIRTWTYISHHAAWLADARHWQERARAVEDRLSDALHERLTQRFVDRRAAALVQRMGEPAALIAAISATGEILIEGHAVGRMAGFRFLPDDPDGDNSAASSAAQKILGGEIKRRVSALEQGPDDDIGLDLAGATEPAMDFRSGTIRWCGAPVAMLIASGDGLKPGLQLIYTEALSGPQRERVRRRLAVWLERRVADVAKPLLKLREAPLAGAARGIAFQLCEALGCVPRAKLDVEIAALGSLERAQLSALDVCIGTLSVFCRAMLKNSRSEFAALLWAVTQEAEMPHRGANPAAVGFAKDPATLPGGYNAMGFVVLGQRVLRADIAERLIAGLGKRSRAGHFAADTALLAIAGCSKKEFPKLVAVLGYSFAGIGEDGQRRYRRTARPASGKPKKKPRPARADPNSPFAELGKHALFGADRLSANRNRATKSGL
ncbi:MAG: helicase-related protein [Proteobacteria bacterium]|nr:helicase-related protein [Pseudomonadota bacterium]MDA1354714.1 helicase-related protein [Pseudomonadota bacterium]